MGFNPREKEYLVVFVLIINNSTPSSEKDIIHPTLRSLFLTNLTTVAMGAIKFYNSLMEVGNFCLLHFLKYGEAQRALSLIPNVVFKGIDKFYIIKSL